MAKRGFQKYIKRNTYLILKSLNITSPKSRSEIIRMIHKKYGIIVFDENLLLRELQNKGLLKYK